MDTKNRWESAKRTDDPIKDAEKILQNLSMKNLVNSLDQNLSFLHAFKEALEEARQLGHFHRRKSDYILERYDELSRLARKLQWKLYARLFWMKREWAKYLPWNWFTSRKG